ncbi:MAG: methionine ABC transporter ATP-binding protein [Peptococcaceae bacterium]|nr:methionine ABC transporter ATP-binding protein [Peptococcaceae bacterium]
MISIKDLSKIYLTANQRIVALDKVTLKVEKGEIFGIIGLSGAGKSTLIRCINRLETPSEGTIYVDDQEIISLGKKDLQQVRQKIGMIFQHFNLLSSRNVFDNVMFPMEIAKIPRDRAEKRAKELLALVGLSDRLLAYPNQLSGGQKQRVGIARALANDPKLLLCDEATSALDPQTTHSILKLLRDINRQLNITILLITHDMNVIKEICDRVAVIDDGAIVEMGKVLDVFSNPASPTSKGFVNSVIGNEIPEELLHLSRSENNQSVSRVIRVSFVGASAGEPVIFRMIRKFDVEASILFGNVSRIKDTPFGSLTLELIGPQSLLQEAVDYLRNQGLEVEVLNNG